MFEKLQDRMNEISKVLNYHSTLCLILDNWERVEAMIIVNSVTLPNVINETIRNVLIEERATCVGWLEREERKMNNEQ